ncbi:MULTISPECIES: AbrB/MazE/SpoVT family DNA-binding domain-containing protein [Cupriavidus]|uniref:AbrB/MazE/SpoVT family DNA-binding domain-containing protein n=1 Tax=Cupriavidus TaxID=106589 RepID=UPI00029165FC|nr:MULTISPECIES: AbrB/MazE/SpoVT family DNA-binding domain-containing protein [Cupriavidus]MCD9122918.1 AbrB/MazE/SpoVT family DNA-binding domain-containing protein [Cupriavidus sp. UGS-1]
MPSVTMTSRGQVTLPAEVRDRLGLSAGDRVEFVMNEATGNYEVIPASQSVKRLKGVLPKPDKPVSVDDMNAAIAEQGASAGDRN